MRNRLAPVVVATLLIPVWGHADLRAQDGAAEPLIVTVTGVMGLLVQVRANPDAPWQRPTVGQRVGVGAEFQTGPRSAVRFTVGDTQTVTLDRLGTSVVLEAIRDAGKIKTDVGMKYGRTRLDVEVAGIEHESTIHAPSSTLAVKGTRTGLDVDPWRTFAWAHDGSVVLDPFLFARFAQIRLGAKGRKVDMTTDDGTPTRTALLRTYVDPQGAFPRDDGEFEAINQNTSLGSAVSRGGVPKPPRSGGFTVPVTNDLIFTLFWLDGRDGQGNAASVDVDLLVASPPTAGDQVLGPKPGTPEGNLVQALNVASGGRHNGDQMGEVALENAGWLNQRPGGTYTATGRFLPTFGSASAVIFANLDGRNLKLPAQTCGSLNNPIQLSDMNTEFQCQVPNVRAVP